MGLLGFLKGLEDRAEKAKTDQIISSVNKQIETMAEERESVLASDDLTPETIGGKRRKYHYKDVNIWVVWQYSGRYGKSCKSAGIKRGDPVQLRAVNNDPEDPEAIAVYWNGDKIGYMKTNRLRNMVRSWRKARLPIRAIVSQVGGEQKIFLELAFYGNPKTKS